MGKGLGFIAACVDPHVDSAKGQVGGGDDFLPPAKVNAALALATRLNAKRKPVAARTVFRENILEQADLSEQEITETAESYGSDMIYSMTLRLV